VYQLLVLNLPLSFSWQQLRDLASSYTEVVSVDLMVDQVTGRSRGMGLVGFGTKEEADYAMEEMQGIEVEGRRLEVRKEDAE
jgi:RNA recognition motif-containing protein